MVLVPGVSLRAQQRVLYTPLAPPLPQARTLVSRYTVRVLALFTRRQQFRGVTGGFVTFRYRPGPTMKRADALSRRPDHLEGINPEPMVMIKPAWLRTLVKDPFNPTVARYQELDDHLPPD